MKYKLTNVPSFALKFGKRKKYNVVYDTLKRAREVKKILEERHNFKRTLIKIRRVKNE